MSMLSIDCDDYREGKYCIQNKSQTTGAIICLQHWGIDGLGADPRMASGPSESYFTPKFVICLQKN